MIDVLSIETILPSMALIIVVVILAFWLLGR